MKNFDNQAAINGFRYIGYILGPLFILAGTIGMFQDPIIGIGFLLSGLIGFDPTRTRIFKFVGYRLNSKATLYFCLIATFGASTVSALIKGTENTDKPSETATASIESGSESAKNTSATIQELPPATVCSMDLGSMKMDQNGDPVGKKQPVTTMGKYLKADTCDVIRISYSLTGSYGDPIAITTEYDATTSKLTEIYTRTNVKNEYTGIDRNNLIKYTTSGEKSWGQLSSYSGVKYDFNNREMAEPVGEGPKPQQSEWDGSVDVVKSYIKNDAKDASSIKFIEWSKVSASNGYWVVKCKYSGTNSFGATVTDVQWFYIKNGKVEKTKQGA